MRSGWLGSGELAGSGAALSNEESLVVATLGGAEFTRLGTVQPIRQARTAIHREITVATADLKVRNGEGIIQRVYLANRKDNLICGARYRR